MISYILKSRWVIGLFVFSLWGCLLSAQDINYDFSASTTDGGTLYLKYLPGSTDNAVIVPPKTTTTTPEKAWGNYSGTNGRIIPATVYHGSKQITIVGIEQYGIRLPNERGKLVLPNSIVTIEQNAIIRNNTYGFNALIDTLVIGTGCKEIGAGAFYLFTDFNEYGGTIYSDNRVSVTCKATNPPHLSKYAFKGFVTYGASDLDEAAAEALTTLYVPMGSVESYLNSDWSEYFPNIVGVDFSDNPATIDESEHIAPRFATVNNGQIIVNGIKNGMVYLFDIKGFLLSTYSCNDNALIIDVPVSGVYIVKADKFPCQKVVVIR